MMLSLTKSLSVLTIAPSLAPGLILECLASLLQADLGGQISSI